MKKLQCAKRAEIERQIGLHDDSGVDSVSRSTTPTSDSASVSPVPFADITTDKNSKGSKKVRASKYAENSPEHATAAIM